MIVWTRKGFLVLVVTFGILISLQLLTESCSGNEQYFKEHSWPSAIGLLISGVIIWFLGTRFNGAPTRVLVDKKSGEDIALRDRHTFFFIPMEYCGLIICVASIAVMFGFGR